MPLPRRASWADEEDSDTDAVAASSPSGSRARRLPFGVFWRAYLRGLLLRQGTRDSMAALQQLLRRDPRAGRLRGLPADLLFYVSFDNEEVARHIQEFACAVRSGSLSPVAMRLWQVLLVMEMGERAETWACDSV